MVPPCHWIEDLEGLSSIKRLTLQCLRCVQEAAEQLKEVADVMVPMATGELAEEGQLQALLQKAGMPFVGSPSEAVVLAGSRAR